MSYPLNITRKQFEEPKGLKCFPFASGRWVTHFAEVVGIEISHGKVTDFLVIKGQNKQGDTGYGVRISVSLNPNFVPNDWQDREGQIARNAERLTKILKAFDLAVFDDSGAWLLPERFDSAIGKVFSFSIIGAEMDGQPVYTDRGHQKTFVAFRGIANTLLPVVMPPDAAGERPVSSCALNSYNASASFGEEVA